MKKTLGWLFGQQHPGLRRAGGRSTRRAGSDGAGRSAGADGNHGSARVNGSTSAMHRSRRLRLRCCRGRTATLMIRAWARTLRPAQRRSRSAIPTSRSPRSMSSAQPICASHRRHGAGHDRRQGSDGHDAGRGDGGADEKPLAQGGVLVTPTLMAELPNRAEHARRGAAGRPDDGSHPQPGLPRQPVRSDEHARPAGRVGGGGSRRSGDGELDGRSDDVWRAGAGRCAAAGGRAAVWAELADAAGQPLAFISDPADAKAPQITARPPIGLNDKSDSTNQTIPGPSQSTLYKFSTPADNYVVLTRLHTLARRCALRAVSPPRVIGQLAPTNGRFAEGMPFGYLALDRLDGHARRAQLPDLCAKGRRHLLRPVHRQPDGWHQPLVHHPAQAHRRCNDLR